MPKIVCVVPTIRPERMEAFRAAWKPLFEKHDVIQITVWDGDKPSVSWSEDEHFGESRFSELVGEGADLVCRHTDAVRNLGFLFAAQMTQPWKPDYILTLDDDVVPIDGDGATNQFVDPIQAHLDALAKRVPLRWMSTAHDTDLYPRGVPYNVREEAPVKLSHGVWVGVPDFDGETQLHLEMCPRCEGDGLAHGADRPFESSGPGTYPGPCPVCKGSKKQMLPHSLPYYVGPIPVGVKFPLCGMNVMVKREALPDFYFAPMGPDSGFPNLHRFADIFMGIMLKREFDRKGWACYTGASAVLHTRASDATKNYEQEKLGRAWLDETFNGEGQWTPDAQRYFESYYDKRVRYAELVTKLLGAT